MLSRAPTPRLKLLNLSPLPLDRRMQFLVVAMLIRYARTFRTPPAPLKKRERQLLQIVLIAEATVSEDLNCPVTLSLRLRSNESYTARRSTRHMVLFALRRQFTSARQGGATNASRNGIWSAWPRSPRPTLACCVATLERGALNLPVASRRKLWSSSSRTSEQWFGPIGDPAIIRATRSYHQAASERRKVDVSGSWGRAADCPYAAQVVLGGLKFNRLAEGTSMIRPTRSGEIITTRHM